MADLPPELEVIAIREANRMLIERDAAFTAQIADLKLWAEASQRAVETFKSWYANTDKYEVVLRLLTEARDLLRDESDCEAWELADKIDAALGSTSDAAGESIG